MTDAANITTAANPPAALPQHPEAFQLAFAEELATADAAEPIPHITERAMMRVRLFLAERAAPSRHAA